MKASACWVTDVIARASNGGSIQRQLVGSLGARGHPAFMPRPRLGLAATRRRDGLSISRAGARGTRGGDDAMLAAPFHSPTRGKPRPLPPPRRRRRARGADGDPAQATGAATPPPRRGRGSPPPKPGTRPGHRCPRWSGQRVELGVATSAPRLHRADGTGSAKCRPAGVAGGHGREVHHPRGARFGRVVEHTSDSWRTRFSPRGGAPDDAVAERQTQFRSLAESSHNFGTT